MKKYVLGFLFNPSLSEVVLIRKTKPEWQAGRLNGVGGKVEDGESVCGAMSREFQEETGIIIPNWYHYATLVGTDFHDYEIAIFTAADTTFDRVRSTTEEEVSVFKVTDIMDLYRADILPNVRWLIHLAISMYCGESSKKFEIKEVR